jgi:hypothetical protein
VPPGAFWGLLASQPASQPKLLAPKKKQKTRKSEKWAFRRGHSEKMTENQAKTL